MTKYVKVSDDHTKLLSAIHTQKPRQIKRLPDDVIHQHHWFMIVEHYPAKPQNLNLYSTTVASWEVNRDRVHFHYEYVLRPLEQRRQYLASKAHHLRDQMLKKPVIFDGNGFERDEASKVRLSGSALMAVIDPTYTVEWITDDNSFVTLTAQDVMNLGKAHAMYESAVVTHGRILKDSIKASDSPEEIDILTGWPSNVYQSDDFS